MLPLRRPASDGLGLRDSSDTRVGTSSFSCPFVDPSKLRRGVPMEISVETDRLIDSNVSFAAECRASMMAGPGKM